MLKTQSRKPRRWTTEKQRQAACRNGTKSKGPVTPAGKAVSSANSTTHGAFANSIDLADIPGYYNRFRELLLEFDVTDHTQLAPVEALLGEIIRGDFYFSVTEFLSLPNSSQDQSLATVHTQEAFLRAASRASRLYTTLQKNSRNEPDNLTKRIKSIASAKIHNTSL